MPIPKTEWIWQNGRFVKWDEATVHVSAHALHYGSSVFEGLRAYESSGGSVILGLDAHVRRLFDSCRIMRMEAPVFGGRSEDRHHRDRAAQRARGRATSVRSCTRGPG